MRAFARISILALLIWPGIVAFVGAPSTTGVASQSSAAPGSVPAVETPFRLQQSASTPTPTVNGTPASPDTRPNIVVWWAADIYPTPDSAADVELNTLFDEFRRIESEASLLVRIKRAEGVGGILSTLHTASDVAPGALPDLVLMRREHLIEAFQSGVIYPLEELIPTIDDNLYPPALELGRIDGTLLGLAYTLEVQHFVYRSTVFGAPPTTLSAILEMGQPFAFVAGPNSGINETLLVQYLDAGGQVLDSNGGPTLEQEPLEEILVFYEQALAENLISPDILDYASPSDYGDAFLNGTLSLAQVDSGTYLTLQGQVQNAVAAPIPTTSGRALTTLDGWLWVLTTADPDRQTGAIAFLDWMMRSENQADFAQSLGTLPSQERALRNWEQVDYKALIDTLLEENTSIWIGDVNASVAAALQTALEAVLSGEQSAADAAADAVASLSS